jgi:hypothetical protein
MRRKMLFGFLFWQAYRPFFAAFAVSMTFFAARRFAVLCG